MFKLGFSGECIVKHFEEFFKVAEKLHTFIAEQPATYVETQKAIKSNQRIVEPEKLLDVCWSCRENALETIRRVLPSAAIQYLKDIRKCESPYLAAGEAKTFSHCLHFEFLCLEITALVFLETSMASNALQQKDLDVTPVYFVDEGDEWKS